MNVCPTSGPVAPPAELVPLMAASLLIPILFIAGFIGIVAFLVWKLVQSHERHQTTLRELADVRLRVTTLENELAAHGSS
jgi:hypothetical protein